MLVKRRNYNTNRQLHTHNIDHLRIGVVSYNLEGSKFTKLKYFFTKLVSRDNLDTSKFDVLIVGLQEVKHIIKTKELHKIPGLYPFHHITILGDRGLIRSATRLIIFSKYKLNIEPAIDNIKKTFKTIKNIIIANIQLPLTPILKEENANNNAKHKPIQRAIQFSVLNCHLPKDTLKKYITNDKLSKLKFKNNIILGDFNSRTEFEYTKKNTGRKKTIKTKKATSKKLTDKSKYNTKYDGILQELERKSLKDLLYNKSKQIEPEFIDTLYQYKDKKEKLITYRELENPKKSKTINSITQPTELPQNPTYKINPKTGQYVYFKKEKRSKKLRVPSYADRILVTGNDILIEKYSTLSSITLSDHLPIMGVYNVKPDTYEYKTNIFIGLYDNIESIPNNVSVIKTDTHTKYNTIKNVSSNSNLETADTTIKQNGITPETTVTTVEQKGITPQVAEYVNTNIKRNHKKKSNKTLKRRHSAPNYKLSLKLNGKHRKTGSLPSRFKYNSIHHSKINKQFTNPTNQQSQPKTHRIGVQGTLPSSTLANNHTPLTSNPEHLSPTSAPAPTPELSVATIPAPPPGPVPIFKNLNKKHNTQNKNTKTNARYIKGITKQKPKTKHQLTELQQHPMFITQSQRYHHNNNKNKTQNKNIKHNSINSKIQQRNKLARELLLKEINKNSSSKINNLKEQIATLNNNIDRKTAQQK